MSRAALLACVLAACGGGDDDGPIEIRDARTDSPGAACGTHGEGTSDGTVDGTTVSPVVSAIALQGATWELAILEAGDCGVRPTGQFIDIVFCSQPAAGTHTLVPRASMSCPGTTGAAQYLDEDTGRVSDLVSGTVTFDYVEEGLCNVGDYDLTFDGGRVTGTFKAVVCQ